MKTSKLIKLSILGGLLSIGALIAVKTSYPNQKQLAPLKQSYEKNKDKVRDPNQEAEKFASLEADKDKFHKDAAEIKEKLETNQSMHEDFLKKREAVLRQIQNLEVEKVQ